MASANPGGQARRIEDGDEWTEAEDAHELREVFLDVLDQPFHGSPFSQLIGNRTLRYYAAESLENAQASIQGLREYLPVLLMEKTYEIQLDPGFNVFAEEGDNGASDGQGLALLKLSTPVSLAAGSAIVAEFSLHPSYAEISQDFFGRGLVDGAIPVQYILVCVTSRAKILQLQAELQPQRHLLTLVHRAREVTFGVVPELKCDSFPYASKKVVINAGYPGIFAVCVSSAIPMEVRYRSMFLWLFNHLGAHWKKNYTIMTPRQAAEKWAYDANDDHTESEMMAIIGLFSVGYCFGQQENVAKQVENRMRAVAAQVGAPATDVGVISRLMIKANYKAEESTGDLDGILGLIVAINSDGQWDPLVLSTDLEVISKLAKRYKWDDLRIGVYTQLRLVSQQFRSTSVRFACGGIPGLKQLLHMFNVEMVGEVDKIVRLEEQVRNRWYTGCVDHLPIHLQINTHKYTVYFGLKYYQAGCDEEERVKFQKYAVEKIGAKLNKHEMKKVEIWATLAAHDGLLCKLDMIRTLPIDGGDGVFMDLDAPTKAIILRELAKDRHPCTWYQCYQAKIEDELILKTREVVRKKLEKEYDAFSRELGEIYNNEIDNARKDRILEKKKRVKREYDALLDLFGGDKYDFGGEIPMDARSTMKNTIDRHADQIRALVASFRDLDV